MKKEKKRKTKDVKKTKMSKAVARVESTFRQMSFIFDAKKSEKSRAENDIDNTKKLIKEAIKKWINKKDGLLCGKLERMMKLSSHKPYYSPSFL